MIKISHQLLSNTLYEVRLNYPAYLQVKGTEKIEGHCALVKAEQDAQNVVIETTVKNIGNMRLVPKLVAELEVNEQKLDNIFETGGIMVLPGGEATFSLQIPIKEGSSYSKWGTIKLYYQDSQGALQVNQKSFEIQPTGVLQ